MTSPAFHPAAEDFFERKPEASPILSFPESENGIRDFFALPTEPPLVAALRGANPEPLTRPNSNGTVAVTTCEGSRDINIDTYYRFLAKVCPDIILAVPDPPQTGVLLAGNRARKTPSAPVWLEFLFKHLDSNASNANAHLFVPILPADLRSQALYIDFLKRRRRPSFLVSPCGRIVVMPHKRHIPRYRNPGITRSSLLKRPSFPTCHATTFLATPTHRSRCLLHCQRRYRHL